MIGGIGRSSEESLDSGNVHSGKGALGTDECCVGKHVVLSLQLIGDLDGITPLPKGHLVRESWNLARDLG